jgi:hypothetical protein
MAGPRKRVMAAPGHPEIKRSKLSKPLSLDEADDASPPASAVALDLALKALFENQELLFATLTE